jgi:aldehyde:ferredoxin oxidoreductase
LIQTILHVDLTNGKTSTEPVPLADVLKYGGGRGVSAKLLYERLEPGIDPLGPDNLMIFAPGTLAGTSAPCSGRTSVTCKGPATNLYLKTSMGGHWGAMFRYAGWNYLMVSGTADRPTYLWIDDDHVELRDAGMLWGQGTRATESAIKQDLRDEDIQVAVIGPAGENGCLFACIMGSRYHAAGRGGAGAVMGAKNLKAIAVRGTRGVRVARPQAFFELTGQVRSELMQDSGTQTQSAYGTSGSLPALNELYMLPSFNFRQPQIEGAERLSGQYLESAGYLSGRVACHACSTGCHRYVVNRSGPFAEVDDSGPELETFMSLGAECGIADTAAVLKANKLCNDYGLDTISTGHVVSWAMECYEKGVIGPEEADGLELTFGNAETLLELIRRIALREGRLGELLAQGTKRAAEEVGGDSWKWAIQAKGLEQSAVDTRVAKSYALAFAVNPRGPDHLMTETYAEFGVSPEARQLIKELCGDEKYANPLLTDKRAEIVRWHEDTYAVTECLGICVFTSTAAFAVNPENMASMMSLALGVEISEEELMLAGRRVVTLERCFNVREGATRADDTLPWRLLHEQVPDGPNAGFVTSPEELDMLLDQYYDMHGWDKETARPTAETLQALGLEFCLQ